MDFQEAGQNIAEIIYQLKYIQEELLKTYGNRATYDLPELAEYNGNLIGELKEAINDFEKSEVVQYISSMTL